MGFDDLINDFSNEKEKVKTTPNLIDETFQLGQTLINKDYLPEISKIKMIKPFLVGITEMNLYKRGWRFQFGSDKHSVGLCSNSNEAMRGESKIGKNIFVSIQFTKHDNNWKENMKGVILHESAHAIVFSIFENKISELHKLDDLHKISHSHGLVWKAVCAAITKNECRMFYENADLKDSFKNYKYNCTFCGHTGYGDYFGFEEECSGCGKAIITEANRS